MLMWPSTVAFDGKLSARPLIYCQSSIFSHNSTISITGLVAQISSANLFRSQKKWPLLTYWPCQEFLIKS
jgi:hypothetical protein